MRTIVKRDSGGQKRKTGDKELSEQGKYPVLAYGKVVWRVKKSSDKSC